MSPPVTEEKKTIAKHLADVFGRPIHVKEYTHDTEPIAVDILRSDDHPVGGVTSYSTLGLSDYVIPWGMGEFPTRLELAGASATANEAFPNILASAAFRMMRTGDVYHPGAVIENYVHQYFPDSPLPHLYFTTPFVWALTAFDAATKKITWLQAMPIAPSEQAYLKTHGDQELERRFKEHRIDVFDINRQPVV